MNKKAITKILVCTTILTSISITGLTTSYAKDNSKKEEKEIVLDKGIKKTSTVSPKTKLKGDVKEKDNIIAGDSIPFHMDYTVPNNIDFDKLTLLDNLEEVLKAPDKSDVHIYLIGEDGQNSTEVTNKGTVVVEGQQVKWVVDENPKQFSGKKLRIEFSAELKYKQNYDKYKEDGKIKIPNNGEMILHDKQNSQDVKVPTDKVYMLPNIIKNKQEKFILDNGKEVKEDTDVKAGETVSYELKFTVTNDEDFNKLSIVDDLPDELDLNEKSIAIFEEDKDITDSFKIEVDNSKEKFIVSAKSPRDWRGKQIVLKFNSTLKYDTNIPDKKKIDNTATLMLDDNSYPTDKVSITTNVVNPTAEKWIITEDGKKAKEDSTSKKD